MIMKKLFIFQAIAALVAMFVSTSASAWLSARAPGTRVRSLPRGRHEYSYRANEKLRHSAKELSTVNVTVLELAATANWLLKEERVADWKTAPGSFSGSSRSAA
jgi:hypothetical protein